ncbi:unnamed protein product [Notodromas monacha]|uniref:Autophagy-related protein 13 n=1 Tax=Notodromas monacha TaxID=399045 RepID=A0A7R9BDY8_9CRUS|nr:unnamed protein product [Notodromas monacha]CAG0913560.1 unnamed protein product [Notodromas monacha]
MASGSSTMSRFSHTALSKPANSAQSDFENYLHALCFKAVQVIVEARLGERISTPSKPDVFGTDWVLSVWARGKLSQKVFKFNIALNKQEEVRKETKKALSGSLPSPGIPLCVEISLKTSDGDVMTLECWQLNVDEPSPSSSPVSPGKSSYLVYNRMSALLKTLISVTRTTPAYGVSRRQSRDAYVICYRVYLGQPTTDTLGKLF